MRGASTLNSVSRRRSLLGRVAAPGGACNVRERYTPPITRISKPASTPSPSTTSPRIVEGIHLVSLYNYLYAWLVDPPGPMDGCGVARPYLFPAARGGVPGSGRHRRRRGRPGDGPVPGAGPGGGGAGDRAPAGGGLAGPAAARHFAAPHWGTVRLFQ